MRVFVCFILLMMGLGFAFVGFIHLGGRQIEFSDVVPTRESGGAATREFIFAEVYLVAAAIVGYWPVIRRVLKLRPQK
jgi:hypothetical protein